jgi:hypothetical protein
MAKIKVHVLNFHDIFSHIEIVLENTSTEPHTYYGVNRWDAPQNQWDIGGPKKYIEEASSAYSFDIEADPYKIVARWRKYWKDTWDDASILGENCAVAAQWFLTEFAGIPKPDLSNVSWNHLIFGIVWPSFIPCPVTLAGRIMSNAKFHIEIRDNPEIANQYSHLFLYTSMSLAALVLGASAFALAVAATILSGGTAALAISGCIAVGMGSTYGFFKAYNTLSAKNISNAQKDTDELHPLIKDDQRPYQEGHLNFSAG